MSTEGSCYGASGSAAMVAAGAYAGEEVSGIHGDRPCVAGLPHGERAVLQYQSLAESQGTQSIDRSNRPLLTALRHNGTRAHSDTCAPIAQSIEYSASPLRDLPSALNS